MDRSMVGKNRLHPPVAMAAPSFPRWADLLPELVCLIGDRLELKGYAGARGACTAWRRALLPLPLSLSPMLLVVVGTDKKDAASQCRPYAASLPARRSLELTAVVSGTRFVGSSNGWLALSIVDPIRSKHSTVFALLNPVAGLEILLPPLVYHSRWVSKVVFTPCPAEDDFAAAAICDGDRVAYVTAGARRWAVMNPISRLTDWNWDHLTDVVYTDNGHAVYCLTQCGDVHVLRLPARRRRKPAAANVVVDEAEAEAEAGPSMPLEFSDLPNWRNFRMTHHARQDRVPPESQGPDLNFPATIKPLLSEANLPFDPTNVFAPPYDTLSSFTSAKNLVFCEGNLYQVWRNQSCTVTLQLPAGGRHRLAEHEILVLRYYHERQPCWEVVKDLGGHSFFVGRNNAVSMYAEGVPGLRGNCVYWIGGHGRDQGMVFDMESGRSTPCSAPPPVAFLPRHPHSTICWYFLSDACNEHKK